MKTAIITIMIAIALIGAAFAAVPPMMSYQGKLMQPSGAPVPDGTYSMVFAIYDVPTSGTALWSETNPSVQVKGGLFATMLGSVVNLPANVFDNPNRFFGVKVGTDPEMMPRQQVASTAFAFRAAVAGTVDDGAITTGKLAVGAVDAAKIGPNAVTADKIADGNVSTEKIAAGAVDATRLSTGAITLGYAEISSAFSTTTVSSYVDVPGLSVTVSVPSGGRRVKVTAFAHFIRDSNAQSLESAIFCDGARINESRTTVTAGAAYPLCHIMSHVPSAGVHTYKLSLYQVSPGLMWLDAVPSSISYMLVELI